MGWYQRRVHGGNCKQTVKMSKLAVFTLLAICVVATIGLSEENSNDFGKVKRSAQNTRTFGLFGNNNNRGNRGGFGGGRGGFGRGRGGNGGRRSNNSGVGFSRGVGGFSNLGFNRGGRGRGGRGGNSGFFG